MDGRWRDSNHAANFFALTTMLSVVCASDLLEILTARLIYDPAGYRELYRSGILHRDISVNNVLIGKPGAVFPNRGVIIDLDMAIWLDRKKSLYGIDFKTVSFPDVHFY